VKETLFALKTLLDKVFHFTDPTKTKWTVMTLERL